ncbi:MAG: cytochrome c [Acidobacteriota bacterium]
MRTWLLALLIIVVSSLVYSQDAPSRSVWDGVYTEDQARNGQQLYNQHCMACHGGSLTGGEQAPPLAGGEFLANWNGLTVGDLFDRIRTTMPLNNPQSLNRETNAGILSYILSVNRFPAGQVELPSRGEVLKLIRLEAERPSAK